MLCMSGFTLTKVSFPGIEFPFDWFAVFHGYLFQKYQAIVIVIHIVKFSQSPSILEMAFSHLLEVVVVLVLFFV